MARIRVNYDKCIGEPYKVCVEMCPVSIFRLRHGAKPEVANEENCILCRSCLVNCPSQAIEILS